MKKIILGTAIVTLASASVFAEDYQFEVGAAYVSGESFDVDIDGYGAYAEFHFDKVDTSKGPYSEAAFLDQSSWVRLTVTSLEPDVPNSEESNDVFFETRFGVGNGVLIEASYTDFDAADDTEFGIGIGTYLTDTLDFVLTYSSFDEADSSSLWADLHGVSELGGETYFSFDLGAGYLDANDENGYGLQGGVSYFFSKSFSIGVSALYESIDEFDGSTYSVTAEYFVTPSIELGANYSSSGQDLDGDSLGVSASFRF